MIFHERQLFSGSFSGFSTNIFSAVERNESVIRALRTETKVVFEFRFCSLMIIIMPWSCTQFAAEVFFPIPHF